MATAVNPLDGVQQDKDGNFYEVVDLKDGSGQQVFKGRTVAELLGKLRVAQENATRKIREQALALRLQTSPDPAPPTRTYKPHQPSADELWQLGQDLNDPAKRAAAIRRATEWELGASLDEVRNTMRAIAEERERAQAFEAGKAFMDEHPEFVPCQQNEDAIFTYLRERNLALTKKNFSIAFEELKAGLVLRAPQTVARGNDAEARIEPPAVTRPRQASSGLSSRQSSAVPPKDGPTVKSKLTEAEIDAMPTDEYMRKINSDPVFAAEALRVLQEAETRRQRR
jgi:hypothetical protein